MDWHIYLASRVRPKSFCRVVWVVGLGSPRGEAALFGAGLGGRGRLPPLLFPCPPLPPLPRAAKLSSGGRTCPGSTGEPGCRLCLGSVGCRRTRLTAIAPSGASRPASATSQGRGRALFADMAANTAAAEAVSSSPPGGACIAIIGFPECVWINHSVQDTGQPLHARGRSSCSRSAEKVRYMTPLPSSRNRARFLHATVHGVPPGG